ncbi:MAG: DUF4956 domain-containing protein [Ruminococcaceae bacterium]|nr:DUF4956 domain-containing protein [Oscillospiraceae bacterium]
MLNSLFSSIFTSNAESTISVAGFLICLAVALILGVMLSFCSSYKSKASKTFNTAIALLPAAVCVVIMMVNGNIGAGVAVAGAFSLVRFRSAPGSGKDIVTIFLTMGCGLILGMGYIAYAVLYSVIMGIIMIIANAAYINKKSNTVKVLKITIPEDLDYNGIFDDAFSKYLSSYENTSVKTSNMGSLYKLKYDIVFKESSKEKDLIDELRCRNGNLEISISNQEVAANEL